MKTNHAYTVLIFAITTGLFTVFYAFLGYRYGTGPGPFFALSMCISALIVLKLRFLHGRVNPLRPLAWAGVIVLAVSYEIGGLAAIAAAVLTRLLTRALPIDETMAIIFPALLLWWFMTYVASLAFFLATGKSPRYIWAWALVIPLGISTLTVGVASFLLAVLPGSIWERGPRHIGNLLLAQPAGADLGLMFILGYPVLGGALGQWLWAAAQPEHSGP